MQLQNTAPISNYVPDRIFFRNKGLINPLAIKIFGVSSKDPSNKNPIGYFGTGFKYAIAVCLREGLEINVWRGKEKYAFALEEQVIRDKSFQCVTLNGETLAYTTELGKRWQVWQAYRELVSNCMDEGGTIDTSFSPLKSEEVVENETVVEVVGSSMIECFQNHDLYFLKPAEPLFVHYYANTTIEVHRGSSNAIYYKGVKVMDLPHPTEYTYNFKSGLELTEDRTVKYEWDIRQALTDCLLRTNNEEYIEDLLLPKKGKYETLEVSIVNKDSTLPSEAFLSICGNMIKKHHMGLKEGARLIYVRRGAKIDEIDKPMTALEEKQLAKAIEFWKRVGHDVDKYPIRVVDFLGENVLGMAKDDTIFLTKRVFMMGTKYIASTLLEEWMHIEYRVEDCTYGMQNMLFDMYTHMTATHLQEPL